MMMMMMMRAGTRATLRCLAPRRRAWPSVRPRRRRLSEAPAKSYDVVIVGGGHNGLVSAAYLARAGLHVAVLEARDLVGGAATTEELVPGYKFSRFSYLAGLLRRSVVEELDLRRHGLEYLARSPSSWTPSIDPAGQALTLGASLDEDHESIAAFSPKDAEACLEYEALLDRCRALLTPLLEAHPPQPFDSTASWAERRTSTRVVTDLVRVGWAHRATLIPLYELLTAPASTILDRYFESEVLKSTLATDAIIGALISPRLAGSAYVLLHHVMGQVVEGRPGVWAYVRGGMGAVSNAIAGAASEAGAEIFTEAKVVKITTRENRTTGVVTADGRRFEAREAVLSNLDPHATFARGLVENETPLPEAFVRHVQDADYACGAFKMNIALKGLPNFACAPNDDGPTPRPHHRATIHFLAGPDRTMEELHSAYLDAASGKCATRPVVEMTIPSALDDTVAPPGGHVCQLFVQYAPYEAPWADPAFKQAFVEKVLGVVEAYAPGFRELIVGNIDALSPLDLEQILGLHRGQICHLGLALHQLAYARPVPGWSSHRTPCDRLYLCGAGAHPGGGVMGAPGRNCARILLQDLGRSPRPR